MGNNVYIDETQDRRKAKSVAAKASEANKKKTVAIKIMKGYVFITPKQWRDKNYLAILKARYNLDKIIRIKKK